MSGRRPGRDYASRSTTYTTTSKQHPRGIPSPGLRHELLLPGCKTLIMTPSPEPAIVAGTPAGLCRRHRIEWICIQSGCVGLARRSVVCCMDW